MHGDLKWDNVLVERAAGDRTGPRWWILDWEFGGWGDPRWDVGCELAEFLRCWIMTTPIVADTSPGNVPPLARYPLERMRPAIGAFCVEYVRARHLGVDFIVDAARFAAARLVQLVYEHMDSRADLTSQALCLLQLSHNILLRPVEAVFELLGARAWT